MERQVRGSGLPLCLCLLLICGWVITPYHKWAGAGEEGQGGCGGHSRQDATALAFPYFLRSSRSPGGYKSITEKTAAAAAAADAGAVFYNYGATGVS